MWARLVVWVGLVGWVAFSLARPEVGDEVGRTALDMMGLGPAPPPTWAPLLPPAGPRALGPAPDDEQGAALLAGRVGVGCLAPGQALQVTLGPKGVESVAVLGPVPACAAEAVWTAPWPHLPARVVVEISVGGP